MADLNEMLEAVASFDEGDIDEAGVLHVNNSMIKDTGDPDYMDVTFGVMDEATGRKGLVNMTVPVGDVYADGDESFVEIDRYGMNEVWNDAGKWSVYGLDLGRHVGSYAQHVAEMQVSEAQASEKQTQAGQDKMREAAAPWKSGDEVVNFLHVNNSMIKDTENPDYKDSSLFKDVTFGVMDPATGKKGLVTATVMNGDVIADTKPQAKDKSYVALDAYPEYTVRNDYGEWVVNGADLVEYSDHYAEYMAEKAAEKQSQAVQKKPTNLLRVNDSMIKNTKQNGLKAVTVGLRDADGKEKLGTIFVGDKQVNSDKNTTELPKAQQKSYVALDRNKDYTFSVRGPKGEDGKPVYEHSQISGADIIEQNQAYMKNKMAQRTKNLEESVEKAPEAEAEAQAGD